MENDSVQLDVGVIVQKYQDHVIQLLSANIVLEARLEAALAEVAQLKEKTSTAPANGAGSVESVLLKEN